MHSSLFLGRGHVFADALSDQLNNLQDSSDEQSFVTNIYQVSLPLAGLALFFLGAYAGFILLTSQGNPEKINEAREIITNAVVGFGLITLSVALLLVLQEVLDLNLPATI